MDPWVALFLDATREALRHDGQGEVEDRDGWLSLTTPAAPVIWRNMVHHAVLDPAEVDARIALVKAHYAALDVPFLWRVTPGCRPVDLAARLEAQGFSWFETLCCLHADARAFPLPDDGEIAVTVVGAEDADAWIRTMGAAWDLPAAGRALFRAQLERDLARGERRHVRFLARVGGVPAGTASMARLERSSHFSGAAVLPAFRGRGVYRALLLERMRLVRERGGSCVTVQAVLETSAPICRRMGFEEACRMETWQFPAGPARA